jgi:hypothetical protein
MGSFIRALRAGVALALTIALCATQAFAQTPAAPALWLVQGPQAKVYLFGTIHLMKPGVAWMTPAIEKALAQSGDLWLEVPEDPSNSSALMAQVQSLALDPDHPLSSKISKADVAQLDTFARANGLPGEAGLEPFRPWFAAMMLTVIPAMKSGYSASSGIDFALRSKMTAAGKPIKGFETLDQQLHLMADLPQPQEVALLHSALVSAATEGDDGIGKLVALWQSGNVEQVARADAAQTALDPALMDILLIKRNANWVKQIDARLHGEGTSFVAVGMAHLAGPGSVIDDLAKLGYTVTRVE